MQLQVTIKGADEIQASLRKYGEEAVKKFGQATYDGAFALAQGIRANPRTPVDTSRMKGSTEAKRTSPLSSVTKLPVEYAEAVHEGTKPHFPPIAALAVWARTHGMAGAEYAIAKNIAKRGTKARPFIEWTLAGGVQKMIDNFFKTVLHSIP